MGVVRGRALGAFAVALGVAAQLAALPRYSGVQHSYDAIGGVRSIEYDVSCARSGRRPRAMRR